MAGDLEHGIVRGYRDIRKLLGVRMSTVYALARFDAARDPRVFVRSGDDARGTVRATVADVWQLFRDWEAARQSSEASQG